MHLDSLDLRKDSLTLLKKLVSCSHPAHLYIFTSRSETFASCVAKNFLLDWLQAPCDSHPDLFELACSGKMGIHTVSRIRELLEDITLSTASGKGRAILIHAADRMLPAAANTLLKALEEPPPKTLIVLTTNALQKILPTITSRAQIIRIPFQPKECTSLPIFSSYAQICAYTDELCTAFEKERAALEKELTSIRLVGGENLTAASRHEIEQEIEGELTLLSQEHARATLNNAYLSLRESSSDPEALSLSLIQSLRAIEKGSELKRIFPLFLQAALG